MKTTAADIPALLLKRADLVTEIRVAEKRLASLRASLETVDGAIVAFAGAKAGIRSETVHRCVGSSRADHIGRAILDALRDAGRPLAQAEIAQAIEGRTGQRPANREIRAALKRQEERGIVCASRNAAMPNLWGVND
jgi:hypothetical protein